MVRSRRPNLGVEYLEGLKRPCTLMEQRRVRIIKSSDQQCPCGRGRAYRECCGKPEKVVSLAQAKWRRSSAELRQKLGEFAEEVVFLREAASAQEVYFAQIDEDIQDLDDELIIERCFEWFIFDYPLSNGQTLIELFGDVCGSRLPFPEAVLLVLWQEARCNFYEVKTVFPGKGVVLKDLAFGEEIWVHEPGVDDDIITGSILYVRILKVGEEYEFSTSAIGLPEAFKAELNSWLKQDFQRWRRTNGQEGSTAWQEYLRSQAHRLNGYVIRLGLGLSAPVLFQVRDDVPSVMPSLRSLFQGDLLKQICATREGRAQMEELLRLIQSAEEIRQIRRRLTAGRTSPAPEERDEQDPGSFAWPEETYAEVASQITSGLECLGFKRKKMKSEALRLWHDFCCRERPNLRKPSAWIAAVIYAVVRREGRKRISQHRLARMYGVAPSSISSNFRRLCHALTPASERGVPVPQAELMKIEPLIHKILHQLKS